MNFKTLNRFFETNLFQRLLEEGFINITKVRNFRMRMEYFKLRESMSATDAIFFLMEKYCLSYDTVHSGVFRK